MLHVCIAEEAGGRGWPITCRFTVLRHDAWLVRMLPWLLIFVGAIIRLGFDEESRDFIGLRFGCLLWSRGLDAITWHLTTLLIHLYWLNRVSLPACVSYPSCDILFLFVNDAIRWDRNANWLHLQVMMLILQLLVTVFHHLLTIIIPNDTCLRFLIILQEHR